MSAEQEIGRVVRLGRGWVEVDLEGRLRRVKLPPNLLTRVGGYVKLLGDCAVAVVGTGQLTPSQRRITDRYE